MTRSEDTSIRVSVVGGVPKNSQSSAVVKTHLSAPFYFLSLLSLTTFIVSLV